MLKQIQLGNSRFTCSVGTLFSAEFDESSFNGNKIDLLFHPVSYTHLDVYKRQLVSLPFPFPGRNDAVFFQKSGKLKRELAGLPAALCMFHGGQREHKFIDGISLPLFQNLFQRSDDGLVHAPLGFW